MKRLLATRLSIKTQINEIWTIVDWGTKVNINGGIILDEKSLY